MFGIGLPELIVIFAVALIVVGPDKLPELAKNLAKQALELKKAAQSIKDSLNEEEMKEGEAWKKISPDSPQIAEHIPKPGLEQDQVPPLTEIERPEFPDTDDSPFQPYRQEEKEPQDEPSTGTDAPKASPSQQLDD